MRRVSRNLLLALLLLLIISGFSTSVDRVEAAGSYNHVWVDYFNSANLKSDWLILNDYPANWAIILAGTNSLRITTQTYYQEHEPFNQFMVNVPDGDFRAMTYVGFIPGESSQSAGMRIRMSNTNYIEIHLTYRSGQEQVDWEINQNGSITQQSMDYGNTYPGIYFRITRTGSTYIGEYKSTSLSADWSPVGNSYVVDYPTALIGLFAGNSLAGAPSIPADFDLMRIEYYAPYPIFMPVVWR